MAKSWQDARGEISLGEMRCVIGDDPCCLDTGFLEKVYDAFVIDGDLRGRLQTNLLKTAVDGMRTVCSESGG